MGCCVGDCCVMNCGFCCIGDFFSCKDSGCCVGNCCVSDSPACSDKGGSSDRSSKKHQEEDHAATIANELAEMRKRSTTDAKKQESDIIDDVNETMAEFVKWIREINKQKYGGRSLNINTKRIEELNENLRKKIIGFIGTRLNDKIVDTNPQVSTILSERDKNKRKKNFDDFYHERMREAIRELIDAIETAVREQSDSIEREIQNRIKELNTAMTEETRAFEELKRLKEQENSRVAEKQIEYMYYANLCDIMFDELKLSGLAIGR